MDAAVKQPAASLPALVWKLLPLAWKRAPGLADGELLPRLEERTCIAVNRVWLDGYRRIVGAVDDGALPTCVPQVLAVGLHLRLLAAPQFSLPVLGMVHIKNVIEERQAIEDEATLFLRAFIAGTRHTPRGIEVDIVTEARLTDDDAPAPWSSIMTALIRTGSRRSAPVQKLLHGPDAGAQPAPLVSSSVVRVRADLGRRYARLAGDANPIHLTAWTAKAFGFPRAIVHGMWTLQRALSEVADSMPRRPRRVEARFAKPVLLPGAIVIDQERVHTVAEGSVVVRPLKPGTPHVFITVRHSP